MVYRAPRVIARREPRPDRGAISSSAPAKSTKACATEHVGRVASAGCPGLRKRLRGRPAPMSASAGPDCASRDDRPTHMMRCDAEWLGRTLAELKPEELSPLLNLGASTKHFRQVEQPYIDKLVFRPLEARGVRVIHSDLKAAEGVDLVGDVFNDADFARLQS